MQIGVDLGGTKTEAAVLGPSGETVWRERRPTPRDDYDATLALIASLTEAASAHTGSTPPVGVGIPGSVSPATGLIRNANSTWLNDKPLGADLERALGRPVRLANDANCLALSEAADGAAADAHTVFAVILGTGVGGGLVVGGKLVEGANRIAGEWGHNPLPGATEGRSCWCGRKDCIETYLAGPAVERAYREDASVPAHEVVERAAKGYGAAEEIVERYARDLARALAGVINILDPDAIVLGGGLSRVGLLYERVPALWGPYIFSDSIATRLLPPKHGDASGVRGAARLWPPGDAR